jgi:hypothetical protein
MVDTYKKKENKKDKLFLRLGKNDYKVGKQAEICNREQKKLQDLQMESNRIATEIEKLDG